jgi:hypothetical protein
MYIKRVVLQNIRGFEEADLDFCPEPKAYAGWSVITGNNSSGKTSFLKAISLAVLGPDQVRGLVQDFSGWVTEGAEEGTISVEIAPDHEVDRTLRGGYPVQGTFWAEVKISREEGRLWDLSSTDRFLRRKKSAINGPWSAATPGWFCLGYGPFRRLYGSSPDAQRLMVLPGRIPHFATLYKEDATLGEGEEWVKQLKYKRLEQRAREEQILDRLLQLVRDDFLRRGVEIEDVDSDGIWLRDTARRRMKLSEMSDGYRSALAMLVDIFRHMVEVYGPDILSVDNEGRAVAVKPGVVLIDEVDAHLHPEWQREIGFWFKRHFPNLQFIVTTHSPIVCQAADNGRIYHMAQPGQGAPFRLDMRDYEKIIAGKPDQILLSPAFGLEHTRSPLAVRSRERRAFLASKGRSKTGLSESERDELKQLDLFADID